MRDKFYLVHGNGVMLSVSVLGYFLTEVSMLRRRLVSFYFIHMKGFVTSRDPNIPSLFIQHSSLLKYLALPTRARLHFVGYWILGQLWEEEGSAVI